MIVDVAVENISITMTRALLLLPSSSSSSAALLLRAAALLYVWCAIYFMLRAWMVETDVVAVTRVDGGTAIDDALLVCCAAAKILWSMMMLLVLLMALSLATCDDAPSLFSKRVILSSLSFTAGSFIFLSSRSFLASRLRAIHPLMW